MQRDEEKPSEEKLHRLHSGGETHPGRSQGVGVKGIAIDEGLANGAGAILRKIARRL